MNEAQEQPAQSMAHIKLKDFDGKVIFEMKSESPLQFPYVIWNNRLFVTSRDDQNTLLERSFHVVVVGKPKPGKASH